jgi:hypothetical protein
MQRALFGSGLPDLDLVVDLSNLVYRAALSRNFRELSHEGRPSGHVYGAFSMLLSLARHWGKGRRVRLVTAVDSSCGWRRELDPRYKANRGSDRIPRGAIDEVRELVAMAPGITLTSPDHEADDVIAAHVSQPGRQYVVLSGDRDLWQLIGSANVQVVRASRDRPVSTADLVETFWTDRPDMVPVAKAVTGDTSDNVSPAFPRFNRDDLALLMRVAARPSGFRHVACQMARSQGAGDAPTTRLKPGTRQAVERDDLWAAFDRNLRITTLVRDCPIVTRDHRPDRAGLEAGLLAFGCRSTVDRIDELFRSHP